MPGIIVAQDSNTVTQVGNVIVIGGSGLTSDQITKLANTPSDTTSELALKAPLASPAFTGTPTGITKTHVGLSNVDNTSDANKPVSTAQQTALDLKADSIDIDTINTTLSSKADLVGGKVPASQLPEGIDEVQEYANLAAFPATGATNVIYIDLFNNKPYRWGGTQYAPTDSGVALGSTSSTAHRGDHGATAYTHSQVSSGNPHNVTKSDIGLSNADNTSDANKPVSTDQQAALDLKANLASPTFTGTVSGITKTMVGLGNVDNTSDLNKPISTATQAALDTKAEPGDFAAAISITGTHTETTTAINFSTNQGYAITLTEDRPFTVSTGLSASNPVGLLKITHAGFTPTFTGVVVLDSPVDKSGVYYLKFTRQADGVIIQTNQNGASNALETNQETLLNDIFSVKPIALGLTVTGTEQVGSILTASYTYFDFASLDESGTAFQWFRYDDVNGNNEASIAGATSVNYTAVSADLNKFLRCRVTPSNASVIGSAWFTAYSGQIGEATEIPIVLGYDDVSTGWTDAGGQERKAQKVVPSANCRISSVSLAHNDAVNPGVDKIIVAVYDGATAPDNQLGISAQVDVSSAGGWHWQQIALSAIVDLTAGETYWLSWATVGAVTFRFKNDQGGRWIGSVASTLPDPMNDGTNVSGTIQYGIHADGIEL